MYEIPAGLGIVPDRTLSNVTMAPDVLLLAIIGLGASALSFLDGVTDVVAKVVVTGAEIGQARTA
jgi:hypothetical protein